MMALMDRAVKVGWIRGAMPHHNLLGRARHCMRTSRGAPRVILAESIGFGLIIAASWLDELMSLPQVLFGGTAGGRNLREAAFETAVVLLVAMPTLIFSSSVTRRLFRLSLFLRVCAWCRRIEANGQWLPLEEFFKQHFDTATSHGMCPECETQVRAAGSLTEVRQ
jgi:hypothetical protein